MTLHLHLDLIYGMHCIDRIPRSKSMTLQKKTPTESVNATELEEKSGEETKDAPFEQERNERPCASAPEKEQIDAKTRKDESSESIDPLNFIEIQSAAQWKAMSQRISWKFDEEDETGEGPPLKEASSAESRLDDEAIQDIFKPTKVEQLRLVCWRVKPWNQPRPRPGQPRLYSSQFAAAWGVDCDEVYPGLFIGDRKSAGHVKFLQKIGVTHVLNTAEGKDEGLVDLSQSHYEGTGIEYLGFPLWDCPMCNVTPYLGCAAEFIATAVEECGGKCLVNCQMGVSRSASCAMAYLMVGKEMSAVDALTQFRRHRDVRPNDGFLEQIAELDNDLRRQRERGRPATIPLSTLADHPRLPQAWNHEFWTKEVSEEEIGMPLVKLGQPCPIIPSTMAPSTRSSSRRSSRPLSRHTSLRRRRSNGSSFKSSSKRTSARNSRRSSRQSSRPLSGSGSGGSLSLRQVPPDGEGEADGEGEVWEWVWEDEDEEGQEPEDEAVSARSHLQEEGAENVDPMPNLPPGGKEKAMLTEENLEMVKEIIEKPEDRWRILWQTTRATSSSAAAGAACDNCETASTGSSARSLSSNVSLPPNMVQPGVEGGDPLSMVKVTSAKQWKAISRKLTINLDGITLNEGDLGSGGGHDDPVPRPNTPSEFKPTTVQQLQLICWRIKPWEQPRARNLFSSIFAYSWGVDCDEVYPNLFIGDEASARNIRFLQRMGITHVLNCAEGVWTDYSFVDLTEEYYEGTGITYLGLQVWDSTKVRMTPYFGCANDFIAMALDGGGGKCLIHCQMGVSRSCVAALVYMMLSKGMDAADVMREFRKRRDVRPNDHFLAQLVELDNELRKERLFNIPRSIRLFRLSELDSLPKPWHYEFWDADVDADSLPFSLSHLGEPRPDMERTRKQQVTPPHLERSSSTSTQPTTASASTRDPKPILATAPPKIPAMTMMEEVLKKWKAGQFVGSPAAPAPSERHSRRPSSSESSEYEWEYYDETEEEDERLEEDGEQDQEENGRNNSRQPKVEVNSAQEWKELSAKVQSGEIDTGSMDTGETEGGSIQ